MIWQERLRHHPRSTQCPVKLLIEAGANLRAKNCDGLTPLKLAFKEKKTNRKKIKLLIQYSKVDEINETDNEGCSILHDLAVNEPQESNVFLREATTVN